MFDWSVEKYLIHNFKNFVIYQYNEKQPAPSYIVHKYRC